MSGTTATYAIKDGATALAQYCYLALNVRHHELHRVGLLHLIKGNAQMFSFRIAPFLIFPFVCILGCSDRGDAPMNANDKRETKGHSDPTVLSFDYLVGPEHLKTFIRGSSKEEILNAIQWRGNFEMATELNEGEVCAISFGLFGGPFSDDPRGTILWAIFVGDKFQKFVEWPKWNEQPEKLGKFPSLMQAVEGKAVNISELEKKDVKPRAPSHTDPGLTAAWLLLQPTVMAGRKESEKKNAELRDQFNASRLKLGMTQEEVESVLKSKPLESGDYPKGYWKIYGSNESLDIRKYLHYANILILFEKDKVSGIYSGSTVPGGRDGIRSLRETTLIEGKMQRPSFADLPAPRN